MTKVFHSINWVPFDHDYNIYPSDGAFLLEVAAGSLAHWRYSLSKEGCSVPFMHPLCNYLGDSLAHASSWSCSFYSMSQWLIYMAFVNLNFPHGSYLCTWMRYLVLAGGQEYNAGLLALSSLSIHAAGYYPGHLCITGTQFQASNRTVATNRALHTYTYSRRTEQNIIIHGATRKANYAL